MSTARPSVCLYITSQERLKKAKETRHCTVSAKCVGALRFAIYIFSSGFRIAAGGQNVGRSVGRCPRLVTNSWSGVRIAWEVTKWDRPLCYASSQNHERCHRSGCTASHQATVKRAPSQLAPALISVLAICSIWKPCLLLAASTDFIYIDNQRGKTAYVGSPVCCGGGEEWPMWPCRVRSALRVVQFRRKGSAITGLREVAWSQEMTLSLSCAVSYHSLTILTSPKRPLTMWLSILIFLWRKRLNDYKELNWIIWRGG